MNTKTSLRAVLLGGALMALSAAAQAADLPRAEPVDHVKACETYGTGFWYIPGTDTCIRIGGYVRFQLYAHGDNVADDVWEGDPLQISGDDLQNDTLSFYTRGLVSFDARTETAYGTLRSFIQIRGTAIDQDNPGFQLDRGFLQFGGLTAGLAPSFFIVDNPVDYFATHNADFVEDQLVLGYTAEFGNGFSASVAIESGERGTQDGNAFVFFDPAEDAGDDPSLSEVRTELPVAVANLRIRQAWGSAMIAGAVGESKARLVDDDGLANAEINEQEVGWAVSGGVTVNLPMIAEGDGAILKAAYSDGLTFYTLGSGAVVPGNITFTALDGDVIDDVDTVKVFTLFGGLVHNWTPALRSNIGVGYFNLDLGTGGFVSGDDSASGTTVTANLVWSPVRNLDVGLELIYAHVDAEENAAAAFDLKKDGDHEDDGFGAVFRIQRNFGS